MPGHLYTSWLIDRFDGLYVSRWQFPSGEREAARCVIGRKISVAKGGFAEMQIFFFNFSPLRILFFGSLYLRSLIYILLRIFFFYFFVNDLNNRILFF